MRVITGKARGRKLITVEGTDVVRPTAENVKEAIFSAIQFEIEGRTVLDLFAGSGQLGIEALSRGAKECYFVDAAAVSIKAVKENLKSTGLEDDAKVVNMPFSAFLKSTRAVFDIAILDPPYNYKLIQKALPNLVEKMSENGVIVCEHEKECVLPKTVGGFEIVRILSHSRTAVTIYRAAADNEENE
jgi:16S rRNA (guanine(966)-N(2))-methyltransferase RsmD